MRHIIYNTTESKFYDVQIKTLSQIYDKSNRFQAISTQLTSNLFTSTVRTIPAIYGGSALYMLVMQRVG